MLQRPRVRRTLQVHQSRSPQGKAGATFEWVDTWVTSSFVRYEVENEGSKPLLYLYWNYLNFLEGTVFYRCSRLSLLRLDLCAPYGLDGDR